MNRKNKGYYIHDMLEMAGNASSPIEGPKSKVFLRNSLNDLKNLKTIVHTKKLRAFKKWKIWAEIGKREKPPDVRESANAIKIAKLLNEHLKLSKLSKYFHKYQRQIWLTKTSNNSSKIKKLAAYFLFNAKQSKTLQAFYTLKTFATQHKNENIMMDEIFKTSNNLFATLFNKLYKKKLGNYFNLIKIFSLSKDYIANEKIYVTKYEQTVRIFVLRWNLMQKQAFLKLYKNYHDDIINTTLTTHNHANKLSCLGKIEKIFQAKYKAIAYMNLKIKLNEKFTDIIFNDFHHASAQNVNNVLQHIFYKTLQISWTRIYMFSLLSENHKRLNALKKKKAARNLMLLSYHKFRGVVCFFMSNWRVKTIKNIKNKNFTQKARNQSLKSLFFTFKNYWLRRRQIYYAKWKIQCKKLFFEEADINSSLLLAVKQILLSLKPCYRFQKQKTFFKWKEISQTTLFENKINSQQELITKLVIKKIIGSFKKATTRVCSIAFNKMYWKLQLGVMILDEREKLFFDMRYKILSMWYQNVLAAKCKSFVHWKKLAGLPKLLKKVGLSINKTKMSNFVGLIDWVAKEQKKYAFVKTKVWIEIEEQTHMARQLKLKEKVILLFVKNQKSKAYQSISRLKMLRNAYVKCANCRIIERRDRYSWIYKYDNIKAALFEQWKNWIFDQKEIKIKFKKLVLRQRKYLIKDLWFIGKQTKDEYDVKMKNLMFQKSQISVPIMYFMVWKVWMRNLKSAFDNINLKFKNDVIIKNDFMIKDDGNASNQNSFDKNENDSINNFSFQMIPEKLNSNNIDIKSHSKDSVDYNDEYEKILTRNAILFVKRTAWYYRQTILYKLLHLLAECSNEYIESEIDTLSEQSYYSSANGGSPMLNKNSSDNDENTTLDS